MRQLDNLFGPHIKKFKDKFNDLPSVDISLSDVGNGENGESIYRVSIGYLDNFVSDLMSSDDEWERVGKMFDELTSQTDETIRRMAEREERMRGLEIEMPRFRNYDGNTFTPVMADEPVYSWPRPRSFEHFCDELEEV
jgi:hypothetical protein